MSRKGLSPENRSARFLGVDPLIGASFWFEAGCWEGETITARRRGNIHYIQYLYHSIMVHNMVSYTHSISRHVHENGVISFASYGMVFWFS